VQRTNALLLCGALQALDEVSRLVPDFGTVALDDGRETIDDCDFDSSIGIDVVVVDSVPVVEMVHHLELCFGDASINTPKRCFRRIPIRCVIREVISHFLLLSDHCCRTDRPKLRGTEAVVDHHDFHDGVVTPCFLYGVFVDLPIGSLERDARVDPLDGQLVFVDAHLFSSLSRVY
jgi:hypothetical protein